MPSFTTEEERKPPIRRTRLDQMVCECVCVFVCVRVSVCVCEWGHDFMLLGLSLPRLPFKLQDPVSTGHRDYHPT